MIKLLEETTYIMGQFEVTVSGLDCEQFSAVLPLCSAMDRKVKAKVLQISADPELAAAVARQQEGKELSPTDISKLAAFGAESNDDFTLSELLTLAQVYEPCILAVKLGEEDVTEEFKALVPNAPKYLKQLGRIILSEYKAAIELPELKKK